MIFLKDDFSQKNTWKYDIFFELSEKMVFSKRAILGHDLSLLSGKMVFFYDNMILLSWAGGERVVI